MINLQSVDYQLISELNLFIYSDFYKTHYVSKIHH